MAFTPSTTPPKIKGRYPRHEREYRTEQLAMFAFQAREDLPPEGFRHEEG